MLRHLLRRKKADEGSITVAIGAKAGLRLEEMRARLRVKERIDVLRRALALLEAILDHCGDQPFTVTAADGHQMELPSLAEPRFRVVGGRDSNREV